MTSLSSANQIMIAVTHVYQDYGGYPPAHAVAAAVLHAAADQVVPTEREPYVPDYPNSHQIEPWHKWTERQHTRAQFLAIATELVEKLDELNCNFNVPNQSALIDRARTVLFQDTTRGKAMSKCSVTVELKISDISMLLAHLHQSSRDGWYYGREAHFCKRRNKLIEILEAKLPQEPLP